MSTLCVKASFGSHLVRRVTFNQPPHSVSIDLFREKIANTFSLSLDYNAFRIAYRDDDGDETEILSSLDLTEAIHYFADDVDDSAPSGSSSNGSGGSTSKQRITIKVNLFVDYEGPSLSDRGSVVGTSENGSAWGDGRNRSEWSASRDGDGRDWQGSADGSQWDDEGRSSVGGYDDGRRGPSGSYHYSSSSYSHQPPPPLPPLPPRPPTSYDPRFHHPSSSSSSSPWPPYQSSYSQPPYPSSSSSSSAYSYNTPSAPPLPTLTRLNSNSGRRRDSDESTHRGGSSSTSTSTSNSSGSGSGSSSGRTDLLLFDLGRADPSSSRQPPLPPTYASNSGSGSGSGSSNDARESGNGNGNGRDGEQRRWLKSQEERLSHFAAVKAARREGEGEGEEGGGGGGEQDGEYEGSEAGGGGDQRLLRPPPPPLPNSQTPTPPLDLPTYLAHLSLSRRSPSPSPSHSRMPTPSILSSVPDSLLRCCGSGCGKELTAFRYVCALCGPILPTSEEEEEEEVRGRGDGDSESEGGVSDDGTQLGGVSRREEGGEGGGEERPLLAGEEGGEAMMDDPLGVNLARETRLPLSPISSPTVLLPPSSFQPPANLILTNEGVYLSTSPSAAPTPASPAAEEQEQEQEQEEPNGFELCSDCIETEGVKHANAMAALARSRGGGAGAGGVQELKHSFCEVMKMGRGSMWQGWREVDYDDDVTCSTCGSGPVQTNRFKCISCPKMELCLACYRSVEEIHPIHSFLAIPDRPARPRSSPSFPSSSSGSSSAGGSDPSSSSSSSFSGHATAEEMRLAILRARGVGGGAVVQRGEPPRLPPKPLKHEGVLCFGCLSDIVGARYSCSQCPSFDLCSKCESLEPPITSPDGYHTSAHILLKINIPVAEELILDATDRARAMTREGGSAIHHHHDQRRRRASSPRGRYRDHDRHARPPIEYERWYAARQQQDPYHHANGGAPPLPPHFFGPPPPHYFTPSGAPWAAPPPPPPPPNYHPSASPLPPIMRAHPRAAEQQSLVVHNVRCRACRKGIKGIRWTCANCGTTPTFDLCSSCERSSHTLHNPLHCFLRLTQPLSKPLPPLSQFLPVLYDPSTPPTHYETANGTGGSSNGSSDGLGEAIVLHPQVICDCCGEAILGPWNRCCHCPNSFDVCTPCLHQIHHDPSHVFLKFTRKVDLALFRELTQLSTANPQPLLTYGVYS